MPFFAKPLHFPKTFGQNTGWVGKRRTTKEVNDDLNEKRREQNSRWADCWSRTEGETAETTRRGGVCRSFLPCPRRRRRWPPRPPQWKFWSEPGVWWASTSVQPWRHQSLIHEARVQLFLAKNSTWIRDRRTVHFQNQKSLEAHNVTFLSYSSVTAALSHQKTW